MIWPFTRRTLPPLDAARSARRDALRQQAIDLKQPSWSLSRHDTFMSCRRRYYYTYYGVYEDPEVARLKRLSALPLWAGHVVHDALERLLKERDALPSATEQEAIVRAAVHEQMLRDWRESEGGASGFRLFEHEYAQPVQQEDKRLLVTIVMRSLRNAFRSETLRGAFEPGRARWLTVEHLVAFEVGHVPLCLRMDLAYRDRDGRVLIVDWKTGPGEGRFNAAQIARNESKNWSVDLRQTPSADPGPLPPRGAAIRRRA